MTRPGLGAGPSEKEKGESQKREDNISRETIQNLLDLPHNMLTPRGLEYMIAKEG